MVFGRPCPSLREDIEIPRVTCFPQSSKVYAKNSLKYVPLVGTTWWFTESIFLKRNYDSDKKTMEKSHAALQVS